jgi:2-polyprenyl-3-methyl-5-hydroxy-6-metoxy-1,4-benzoquinol methylase
MITIPEIQDIIMSNNPHGYYHTYKQEEQGYWQYIPDWIIQYSYNNRLKNFIDIGMAYGTLGIFTKLNTDANFYGIDFVKYASDELIQKYDINYKLANIELDNFDEYYEKFDMCIFTETLEHMRYSPINVLTKIKNMLTKNGVIMLTTPDSSSKWGRVKKYYADWKHMLLPYPIPRMQFKDEHIYQFSILELKEIFDICKLKIDKWELSEPREGYRHFNIQLSKK